MRRQWRRPDRELGAARVRVPAGEEREQGRQHAGGGGSTYGRGSRGDRQGGAGGRHGDGMARQCLPLVPQ